MSEFWSRLSGFDYLNIISCVFTVLALVFTLYFWLLDKLSEDESKFIEGKKEFLDILTTTLEEIKDDPDLRTIRDNIKKVNDRLEVIVNYRFWARSSVNDDYRKIQRFYQDSRYLLSTVRRAIESGDAGQEKLSLASISDLEAEEKNDILTDYRKGLNYIIDFVENWQ